jgi:TPR repeat protein
LKWYELAALQGHGDAQGNLGVMYAKGEGVTQDYKIAHMWFNVAAAAGNSIAAKNREAMTQKMNPQEISEAQTMARDWQAGLPSTGCA